jgi:hypothetical protein
MVRTGLVLIVSMSIGIVAPAKRQESLRVRLHTSALSGSTRLQNSARARRSRHKRRVQKIGDLEALNLQIYLL